MEDKGKVSDYKISLLQISAQPSITKGGKGEKKRQRRVRKKTMQKAGVQPSILLLMRPGEGKKGGGKKRSARKGKTNILLYSCILRFIASTTEMKEKKKKKGKGKEKGGREKCIACRGRQRDRKKKRERRGGELEKKGRRIV